MSEDYSDTANRLWKSFIDAASPTNIILKAISFIVLIALTAVPYLVMNLNKFALEVQSQTAVTVTDKILGTLWVLSETIYQGWFIGLSTFWQTLLEVLNGTYLWGSIVVSIIVFVLAAFSLYQPLALLANIFDAKKGKEYKVGVVIAFTILVTFLMTPIASFIMDDATITSGLTVAGENIDTPEMGELIEINDTAANDPLKEKGPQVGIAVLDMGDDSNETI